MSGMYQSHRNRGIGAFLSRIYVIIRDHQIYGVHTDSGVVIGVGDCTEGITVTRRDPGYVKLLTHNVGEKEGEIQTPGSSPTRTLGKDKLTRSARGTDTIDGGLVLRIRLRILVVCRTQYNHTRLNTVDAAMPLGSFIMSKMTWLFEAY